MSIKFSMEYSILLYIPSFIMPSFWNSSNESGKLSLPLYATKVYDTKLILIRTNYYINNPYYKLRQHQIL